MAAYRVLHWPDDTCQPPGRSILFRHDRWVRRYTWPDGDRSDQVIRTASEHEGQLPEDWEPDRPVPEGWISTHLVAQINDVPGGPNQARWIAEHIARHDPSRVLREVAAKRRVLERHDPVEVWNNGGKRVAYVECSTCAEGVGERMAVDWPCPELTGMAAIWVDHPDFDPSWRTDG